ncbi:hypothetical protein EI290_14435 [Hymenobacter metallilatus]|uniref:Uncharacterized protein n=1 Tax=Hymenobacter metallilatus TaxID=2493666 RepID=A0A3R9M6C3_9BACT|nr:hypothetical protein EI290_14435 [Hymenobacter metallilatus]
MLLGHALAFGKLIVTHEPFVMNTEQQTGEAYHDYQAGTCGRWVT